MMTMTTVPLEMTSTWTNTDRARPFANVNVLARQVGAQALKLKL
jgi:hypothetical protein